MNSQDHERAGELFLAARELPPDERVPFLDDACCTDHALRTEVESLLAADARASMLDNVRGLDLRAGLRDLADEVRGLPDDPPRAIPERIGRFRIVRWIGQGGMGTVYEAEQDYPNRHVALKVLRPDIGRVSLTKRFEREAHFLGQLQHPGIAQIYEAGFADPNAANAPSVPYLAMELVRGGPIDAYAAEHGLTARQRMDLIARVCDALHYAHARGIIHRDLKPTNILVDESGQPKILDFGVARATDADIKSVTLQTEAGQLVGTLAYMSPEQTAGDSRGLDERSDVYALGVILYELLAGDLPCGLRHVSIPEAVRVIREVEPTRLGSVDTHYRGDIETIVTKTLEKDRARRYPSAAALAADIRRYLADQPILARPVSTFYQFRKFARRNKGLVGGLAMTFIALVAGLIGTVGFLVEARAQRDAAVAARMEAERVAEFQAQVLSSQTAREFGDNLLTDLQQEYRRALKEAGLSNDDIETKGVAFDEALGRINGVNLGRTVLSDSQADRAVRLLEQGFTDDPVVEARLRESVASIYDRLGMYGDAAKQFDQVVAARRAHLGPDDRRTLEAQRQAADAHRRTGQINQAESLLRDTLAQQRRVLGEDDRDTLATMASLSRLLMKKAELDEADTLLTAAVNASRRMLGPEDPDTLTRLNELALLHLDQGKFREAIAAFRELVDIQQRRLGPDDPAVITIRNNLMSVLFKMNRLDEAEPIARELIASSERVNGRDHPRTIMARNNLGIVLLRLGRLSDAEELLRAAREAGARQLSPENDLRMKTTSNLIDVLLAEKRPAEAEGLCQELLQVRRAMQEPSPGLVAQTLEQLGWADFDQGHWDKAQDAWRECVDLRAKISTGHWLTNRARSELGMALAKGARFEDAETLLIGSYQALAAQRDEIPPGDGAHCIEDARTRLVELYQAWGKPTEAARWRLPTTDTVPSDRR